MNEKFVGVSSYRISPNTIYMTRPLPCLLFSLFMFQWTLPQCNLFLWRLCFNLCGGRYAFPSGNAMKHTHTHWPQTFYVHSTHFTIFVNTYCLLIHMYMFVHIYITLRCFLHIFFHISLDCTHSEPAIFVVGPISGDTCIHLTMHTNT